jgi:hypothetical protein
LSNPLFFRTKIRIPIIPDKSNPISSNIPNDIEAKNPVIDHKSGIIITTYEILLPENNNIPNVNITVGHGKPNVGEFGY